MTEDKKSEIDEIALSTIILHLSDSVVRKVDEMKSTAELWQKLDELYLVRSLPDRILLLEKFFGFRMDTSKDLDSNLDYFSACLVMCFLFLFLCLELCVTYSIQELVKVC